MNNSAFNTLIHSSIMRSFAPFLYLLVLCLSVFSACGQSQEPDDPFMKIEYPGTVLFQNIQGYGDIAYVKKGRGGKTILLIHGLGGYLKHWMYSIDDLANDFEVIAVDLPGYGKSFKEGVSGGMKDQADFLAQFISSLNLNNVWLAGHSMGGQISMTLALEHPGLIQGLILLAPAGIESFNEFQANLFKTNFRPETVINTTDEQIYSNLRLNFVDQNHPAVEILARDRIAIKDSPAFELHAKAVAGGVAGMVNEPVFARLSEIEHPVLLVFSSDDGLIPNRLFNPTLNAQKLIDVAIEKLPNVTTKLYSGVGHLLQLENADLVNSEIRNFLISR